MNLLEIGERLKSIRGEASQVEFADKVGVSLSSWRRYELGDRAPDAETLIALHERLGANPLWVLRGVRESVEAEMTRLVNTAGRVLGDRLSMVRFEWQGDVIEIDPADYAYVPVFDVEFGAGPGRVVDFDEPQSAWDAYRKSWLRSKGLLGAMLFKATISGDSMFPVLRDGSVELFNASDKIIRSGEIYGIRFGDENIAKYLRQLPGGLVEISSHSSEPQHASFTVRAEEFGNGIEIAGRLVR